MPARENDLAMDNRVERRSLISRVPTPSESQSRTSACSTHAAPATVDCRCRTQRPHC